MREHDSPCPAASPLTSGQVCETRPCCSRRDTLMEANNCHVSNVPWQLLSLPAGPHKAASAPTATIDTINCHCVQGSWSRQGSHSWRRFQRPLAACCISGRSLLDVISSGPPSQLVASVSAPVHACCSSAREQLNSFIISSVNEAPLANEAGV